MNDTDTTATAPGDGYPDGPAEYHRATLGVGPDGAAVLTVPCRVPPADCTGLSVWLGDGYGYAVPDALFGTVLRVRVDGEPRIASAAYEPKDATPYGSVLVMDVHVDRRNPRAAALALDAALGVPLRVGYAWTAAPGDPTSAEVYAVHLSAGPAPPPRPLTPSERTARVFRRAAREWVRRRLGRGISVAVHDRPWPHGDGEHHVLFRLGNAERFLEKVVDTRLHHSAVAHAAVMAVDEFVDEAFPRGVLPVPK